ncbi:hypothetical protein EVAR_44164_1 [Eumeta japonica]|uniref:Endonuclease/exonuclease/phosphatase domain-containing protein n=1 Tax=Eumeta variegata TaxID=151549 RepID=A0A4C1VZF6_EUMVA|nr:hypothetical protein EVAR_44164_1 [Eumeta japonica]
MYFGLSTLAKIQNMEANNVILAGDVNAWSHWWGTRAKDPREAAHNAFLNEMEFQGWRAGEWRELSLLEIRIDGSLETPEANLHVEIQHEEGEVVGVLFAFRKCTLTEGNDTENHRKHN